MNMNYYVKFKHSLDYLKFKFDLHLKSLLRNQEKSNEINNFHLKMILECLRQVDKNFANTIQYNTIQSSSNDFILNLKRQFDIKSHDLICRVAKSVDLSSWISEQNYVHQMLAKRLCENFSDSDKYKVEINYLRSKNELMLFPYPFIEEYDPNQIKIQFDSQNQLKYVIHRGKKLYFPVDRDDESIRSEYNRLLIEQDERCPHNYFDDVCNVEEDSIFVDLGAAEGIISLNVVEKAKEIYLAESSDSWIKALRYTFSDYADKIHIVKKFAWQYDTESTFCLDTLLTEYKNEKIFIKMDIEGSEYDTIQGAKNVLMNNDCRLSCATYHAEEDASNIKNLLENCGYRTWFSDGYMLFFYGNMTMLNGKYERIKPPYFRKCIIRAIK